MARVRIVLAGLSGVLRDVIRAQLDADPAMEVVDECPPAERLPALLERVPVDVVVLGIDTEPGRQAVCELMAARERLGLLTVASGGRAVRVHVCRSRAVEPSVEGIRGAILRTAAELVDVPDPAG